MKREKILSTAVIMAGILTVTGCGVNTTVSAPEANISETVQTEIVQSEPVQTETGSAEEKQSGTEPVAVSSEEVSAPETEQAEETALDADKAMMAARKYYYEKNPDMEDMEGSDEYTMYWEVESADEKEIVVLFRSYTAAQVRFHIDAATGDAYITEFVPGITEDEEKTDETFNVKDYMD